MSPRVRRVPQHLRGQIGVHISLARHHSARRGSEAPADLLVDYIERERSPKHIHSLVEYPPCNSGDGVLCKGGTLLLPQGTSGCLRVRLFHRETCVLVTDKCSISTRVSLALSTHVFEYS